MIANEDIMEIMEIMETKYVSDSMIKVISFRCVMLYNCMKKSCYIKTRDQIRSDLIVKQFFVRYLCNKHFCNFSIHFNSINAYLHYKNYCL